MPTLHVHLDEAGNFDFTPKGTAFYTFTAAWTYDPASLAAKLTALRFALIKSGNAPSLDGFHACQDPKPRRDAVIDTLLSDYYWNSASIVIEKRKVNPTIRDEQQFYPQFLTMVLRFVLKGRVKVGTTQVLVYTDTLPFPRKQRSAVESTIRRECRLRLGPLPYQVLHHRMESNAWIQVADYANWAVQRKHETGDLDAYNRLRPRLASPELVLTDRGDGTIYY